MSVPACAAAAMGLTRWEQTSQVVMLQRLCRPCLENMSHPSLQRRRGRPCLPSQPGLRGNCHESHAATASAVPRPARHVQAIRQRLNDPVSALTQARGRRRVQGIQATMCMSIVSAVAPGLMRRTIGISLVLVQRPRDAPHTHRDISCPDL